MFLINFVDLPIFHFLFASRTISDYLYHFTVCAATTISTLCTCALFVLVRRLLYPHVYVGICSSINMAASDFHHPWGPSVDAYRWLVHILTPGFVVR